MANPAVEPANAVRLAVSRLEAIRDFIDHPSDQSFTSVPQGRLPSCRLVSFVAAFLVFQIRVSTSTAESVCADDQISQRGDRVVTAAIAMWHSREKTARRSTLHNQSARNGHRCYAPTVYSSVDRRAGLARCAGVEHQRRSAGASVGE
jgi:hypothetical protein